jgi:hypothetical protein
MVRLGVGGSSGEGVVSSSAETRVGVAWETDSVLIQ